MLSPFLVLFARALSSRWAASGDRAIIELRTRDIGTRDTPLIGPYSRFGWHHPGPALYFLLAAPYRLLSSHSNGLLAGAAIIGAAAIVAIVAAGLRGSPTRYGGVFVLLVSVVLVRALGATFLWDAWNPNVIVLPFLALVVVSWWVATGEDRALPIAVALASFLSQTHVSLGPEVAALLALQLAWLFAATRTDDRSRFRRSVAVSLGVALVMWLPPIIEQFQPSGGNLGAIWRFWTAKHDTLGFAKGARLLATQLSIPAPWITGHETAWPEPIPPLTLRSSIPFALIVLMVAAVVAHRRRDRVALAACSIAATVVIVAWISLARIVGPPFSYLVRWTWVVGATCWLAAGIALLPALTDRVGTVGTARLTRVLAAVMVAVLAGVTFQAVSADPPSRKKSTVVRVLLDRSLRELRAQPGPVVVDVLPHALDAAEILVGVVSGAIEHGIDARFLPGLVGDVGTDNVLQPRRAGTLAFVIVGKFEIFVFSRNRANRRIALYNGRSIVAALFVRSPPP